MPEQDRGATVVEYVILAAALAAVLVLCLAALHVTIVGTFDRAAQQDYVPTHTATWEPTTESAPEPWTPTYTPCWRHWHPCD